MRSFGRLEALQTSCSLSGVTDGVAQGLRHGGNLLDTCCSHSSYRHALLPFRHASGGMWSLSLQLPCLRNLRSVSHGGLMKPVTSYHPRPVCRPRSEWRRAPREQQKKNAEARSAGWRGITRWTASKQSTVFFAARAQVVHGTTPQSTSLFALSFLDWTYLLGLFLSVASLIQRSETQEKQKKKHMRGTILRSSLSQNY